MSKQTHVSPAGPATTMSSRVVQPDDEDLYQQWMQRALEDALASPHSVGATVLPAETGQGDIHRLVYAFSDAASLRAWENSPVRRGLEREADTFSTAQPEPDSGGDNAAAVLGESSPTSSAPAPAPAKWKMALSTFVVAYVLTAIIIPREQAWIPVTWSFYAVNVLTNVLLAVGITYLGLPLVTRVLGRWLYPVQRSAGSRPDR